MITAEMLRRLSAHAREDYIAAFVGGEDVLKRWSFDTPLRLAALLATVCHETGGLTIVRESGKYSAERIKQVWPTRPEAVKFAGDAKGLFNLVYGSRMGNERDGINDDDGWRYRGGGMIQLTGRDSYTEAGKAIGVDLGGRPELIEDATVSLQAACWEMSKLVSYCDMGERGWKAVCNGINRGQALSKLDPIGWADRQLWYKRCCDVLGVTGNAVDDALRLGDQGPLVAAMQGRLTALGFASGRADGVFGSRTRAAVLAFQAENGLATDGTIGAETRSVLNSENAKSMPVGERSIETAEDLKAAGSQIVVDAQAVKSGAKVVAAVSVAAGGAQQAAPVDVIAVTKDTVTEISSWHAITDLMATTAQWATSHLWILGIVIAFAFWRWGRNIEWKRVLDHQLGNTLSR